MADDGDDSGRDAHGAEYDLEEGEPTDAPGYSEEDAERDADAHLEEDVEAQLSPEEAAEAAAGGMDFHDIVHGLPAFANAENRALNERLLAQQRKLATLHAEAGDHDSRLDVMKEHLAAVRSELAHAEELLEARGKELATEEHLKALTERAVGRMRQEIAGLDKQSDALATQLSAVQASIFRGSEKLEAYKSRMHLAQEELDALASRAKAKEEDQIALAKYARTDDAKVRDMARDLERLTGALEGKKAELEREVTETKAKQVEVDKVAEDFRSLHAERQALVTQWQDALAAIERRDGDIAKAAEAFAAVKESVTARRSRIKDAEALLARLLGENKELESSIETRTRAVGQQRDEMAALTERVSSFREEVELLKSSVSAAASELTAKRSASKALEADRITKEAAVTVAKAAVEDMKAQLTAATAAVASTESSLAEREEYLRKEQTRVDTAERRLGILKEQLFKANEAVSKLRVEESTLRAEIAGSQRTSRNLGDRIKELDAQSLAQQEHVYAAEFQIQQMERKIARAKGDVSDEEKRALQERIAVLQQTLDDAITLEKSLAAQAKSVKDELRTSQRYQAQLTSALEEIQGRIDELLLQNKSAEEGLRKLVKEKEGAMVSHDVLKLEVRKLRDALSAKTDEVFTLENRAAQLAMTMEARKKEIEASKAVQRAAMKLVEDERHKLAMDLTDRQAKIGLLKTKYEALCAKLRGSGDGDDGEPKSQAYFILKAAQKREELQREGDELDASIRKAEREVKALVATLGHLTTRNSALRDALHRVDADSDEASGVRALESKGKEVADMVFRRKRELAQLQQQADENGRKVAAMEERLVTLTAHMKQLEATQNKVENDRMAQLEVVMSTQQRADALRLQHRRRVRGRGPASSVPGAGDATPDEVAFVAQGVKECNASVLFTLGQLAREFPVLKPSLAGALTQFGLKMPTRPPSRVPGTTAAASAGFASSMSGDTGAGTPARPGTTGSAVAAVPVSPMSFPPSPAPATVGMRGHAPLAASRPSSAQSSTSMKSTGSGSARGAAPASGPGIAAGRKGPVAAAGAAVLGLSIAGSSAAAATAVSTSTAAARGAPSSGKPPTPTAAFGRPGAR